MLGWREFEDRVAEYFKRHGYIVKLNDEVSGSSGVQYEVDVLAFDKNFNEVRIACQCKAWQNPVDRDQILLWVKVCEDIHAIPAFASTSGYTDSALKLGRKLNCILLSYDGQIDAVMRVGIKTGLLFEEEPEARIVEARRTAVKVKSLINQINQLLEKKYSEEEIELLRNEAKRLFNETISFYRNALKTIRDKYLLLEFGDFLNSYSFVLENGEDERKLEREAIQCYINALKEHLKEFPEILRKLGYSPYYPRGLLALEFENVIGFPVFSDEKIQAPLLKMYLETNPDDARAWAHLARHYAEIGEFDKADQACEKALSISPNDTEIIGLLTHIYSIIVEEAFERRTEKRQLFLDKLIELLRRRCELDPEDLFSWVKLASIHYPSPSSPLYPEVRKNLDEAIHCMEEALKRIPDSLSCWKTLGDLYFEKGDKEKALKCFSKALEIREELRKSK